ALTSPDYVPGPEEPEQAPPLPEFVPEPIYQKFMPPDDEVFLAEEQPLPATVSPTTDLPKYIADSDLEEDEEDPEEDPDDYPADGGDNDDDDDEASDNDEDDDDNVEEDKDREEEEHPPSVDYTEVVRLLAIPTPPPSPLSPLSSPLPQILSPLPRILSLPLPVSSPPLLASLTYPLRYRAAMIWLKAETPSTSHLLPSTGVSKVILPPQKRLCIALGLRYEVDESSSAPTARPTRGFRADYGFVGTLYDEIRRDPKRYVGYGITWDDMDTNEIYMRLDDAHDERLLMSGQLNMLCKDRHAYARTAKLMETEARLSHEAWVQSTDASDIARSETQVTELQSQQGPAGSSAQPEILEEAGSSFYICYVVAMLYSLLSVTGNSRLASL
ncbi:hypothetical protein Tco_1260045, partial [Tanacetum coccineum]